MLGSRAPRVVFSTMRNTWPSCWQVASTKPWTPSWRRTFLFRKAALAELGPARKFHWATHSHASQAAPVFSFVCGQSGWGGTLVGGCPEGRHPPSRAVVLTECRAGKRCGLDVGQVLLVMFWAVFRSFVAGHGTIFHAYMYSIF